MKITIIGAGAMGCRFGAALTQSGAEVTLVDVWSEHVDAMNAQGLRVTRNGGDTYLLIPATTDIGATGKADLAIIFTKSMHTEAALDSALAVIGGDTPVATFQNGLGNIDILERRAGRGRTIAGITNYPTDLIGPGHVNTDGKGYTKLMALGKSCEAESIELCRLLKASGMNCELSDDIMKEIWEKLAFNNAMNAITALTRLRVGHMGGSPYGFELCSQVAREVCDVARAEGVDADYDTVVATFRKVVDPNESGNHLTSMLQDVLRGRATEIDSICGAVIIRAAAKGIATPRLSTIYNLIKLTEENYANQVTHIH